MNKFTTTTKDYTPLTFNTSVLRTDTVPVELKKIYI